MITRFSRSGKRLDALLDDLKHELWTESLKESSTRAETKARNRVYDAIDVVRTHIYRTHIKGKQ